MRFASLVLCGLSAASCTKADLFVPQELRDHPIDNKISVRGAFCAEDAQSLQGFLKIMFIVDRSNSMLVTDPSNQRVTAVQDVVERFIDDPLTYKLRDGVEFAIMGFYGDPVMQTRDARGLDGFSAKGQEVLYAVTELAHNGANTSYDKTLAQAFLVLDSDMARLSDLARKRTRYEIIFVSDGMPFPNNCRGEANSPTAAVTAVRRLVSISSLHRVPITFHTAFVSDPREFIPGTDGDSSVDGNSDPLDFNYTGSVGEEVRALLMKMAEVGHGTFKQFDNGDAITFAGFEFADARRLFALSNFVVANTNALPAVDHDDPDSDADGLTDAEEQLIGTRPTLADSDADGLNDALEWRFRASGLDPIDPTDGQCPDVERVDTDGDFMLDCEELFLGTSRREMDSDADGLADYVEVLAGSDAKSAGPLQDIQTDSDADGGQNAEEVRWHTNPRADDVAARSKIAYNYRQTELPITTGQACYQFDVSNIGLASTQRALPVENVSNLYRQDGWNRVMLYFAETPYDEPLAQPLYRVACVEGRFIEDRDLKMPANGEFNLPLRRPSDTYRASEVLRANQATCQAGINQDCGTDTLWCRFDDAGACNCFRPPLLPGDPQNGIPAGPCPACSNGVDDDGDGRTDYPYDPDCFESTDDDESPSSLCSNGVDDDGDGLIDFPFDPDCTEAYAGSEAGSSQPECHDGLDNDGDGATDFPNDAGCYAASDATEAQNIENPVSECDDDLDNDGDGRVDFPDDLGCSSLTDITEKGPAVCFYCEQIVYEGPNPGSRNDDVPGQPGQCDLGRGICKPRSGRLIGNPPTTTVACTNRAQCRGAPCVNGSCVTCITNSDCDSAAGAADGLCDPKVGWCLTPSFVPKTCAADADCAAPAGPGGPCDTALGYCAVDPYFACHSERDCKKGDLCSPERGFCLNRVFTTAQCGDEAPCTAGLCDENLGWCLPSEESQQCVHNDECPFGDCRSAYCDQQTFVFPEDFRPEVDCFLAR